VASTPSFILILFMVLEHLHSNRMTAGPQKPDRCSQKSLERTCPEIRYFLLTIYNSLLTQEQIIWSSYMSVDLMVIEVLLELLSVNNRLLVNGCKYFLCNDIPPTIKLMTVVRVSGYRSRGPGFDSRRLQIF
jgi:hypothetical protein